MPTAFRFTTEDLECFPDLPGVRYEIIDGELYVSTAPGFAHQYEIGRLLYCMEDWDIRSGLGMAILGPGVIFGPPDNVIPDLVWIRRDRLAGALDDGGHLRVAPDIIVEAISPGRANEVRDRELKLDLYARRGVAEYWILDGQTRSAELYRRQGDALPLAARLSGEAELTSPLLPGFSCPLPSLWAPAL